MKKSIAILLAALLLLTFAGCVKKKENAKQAEPTAVPTAVPTAEPTAVPDPNANLYGTWAVDFASMMSAEEIAQMEAFGMSLDQIKMEYTFNPDGTGRAVADMFGEKQDVAFTYTAKDGKLTLTATVDGETSTMEADYSIDGNTLTMTSDGETMTFKRK